MQHAETPRHGHAPIKMRRAADGFDDIKAVGDFWIGEKGEGEYRQLYFAAAIPSKHGQGWTFINLPIGEREKPAQSPSWKWDGNREAPTLEPSIWTHGHWHGFVRAGEMVEA